MARDRRQRPASFKVLEFSALQIAAGDLTDFRVSCPGQFGAHEVITRKTQDQPDNERTKPAKGLAMKSGFKRPGAKAPGAKPAAPAAEAPGEPAQAPVDAAPVAESAPAESTPAPDQVETNGSTKSADDSDRPAPPTAKPGGLGFKSGAKAPGRRN